MRMIHWSFSLAFSLFLVGILSTSAFAIDDYGLNPVQKGLGLDVSFTGNTESVGTNFVLELKDGNNTLHTYGPVATAGTAPGTGTFTIPAADITPGTLFSVELFLSDSADPTLPTGSSLSQTSVIVTDSHNTRMSHQPDANVDVNGSGQTNANETGFNNQNKSRDGQAVHGFYQNNTNSCASCHQTHTGADDNLLFKDGVYSTCSACHDGTTGAYNSFKPVDDKTPNSVAGTFDVMKDGHNGSLHVSDGTLRVSAAPGGNTTAADTNEQWGQEFNCASCHAPHGSGSNYENNLNLDPLGWGTVQYSTASNDAKNGKLFKNIPIYAVAEIPTNIDTPYILVKTAVTADDLSADTTKNNYFFKRVADSDSGFIVGTQVIMTYRWDGTKYIPDYSLWLREKGYPFKADTILYNDDWANLTLTEENHYNDSSKELTSSADIHVVWRDGFAWGSGVANIKSAQVSLGIDVETTDNIRSLFDNTYVVKDDNKNVISTKSYIPDSGTEMSKYCTSCHTDYLSSSRKNETGIYTIAHRHKTTDNLTCIRCHFAHGSEAQIMKDANDNTYFDLTAAGKVFDTTVPADATQAQKDTAATNAENALKYFEDINPSSALKRYTGMSICFACHGKGEQFMGNPNNIDATIGEKLKSGEPGTTRSN